MQSILRWFRRLAWYAGLLLVLCAAALAVYVWRSFPTLSGEQRISGLQGSVRITRDTADVTHIFATSERDAAFALGYTHAQERSWQLEFNRRLMHGQLSALLGPATLETDKLMRSLGIARAAQRQLAALPAQAQDQLAAYAQGINSFHAEAGQALPPEFYVLRTQPGTWTAADSMGWGIMMALDLGGNWGLEFARLSAAQKLPTERLWQLFAPYPGEAPASQVDFAKLYAELGVYNTVAAAATATATATAATATSLAVQAAGSDAGQAVWDAEIGNIEGKGSNNWVVAGSHTASGKPLLANDPHLGLSAPAIWYFARLHVSQDGQASNPAPQLNVMGATLPGLPTVVLGRNAKVAWGFTNTGPDVQDLYLEQINPANPAQYKTPTGWADFETRTETIAIKGQNDLAYTYRSTRHGPVVSDAQASHGLLIDLKKYVLALRWSALADDNRTVLAGMNAAKAQTTAELLKAFADYSAPMQNLVAADVQGTIAYKAIGRVPLRQRGNDIKGIAPAPGWDAKYDWDGWLPYDQNPESSGSKGWVATANQRIHSANYPHFLGQDWTTPQRFDRIEQLLAATPKHDATSMQRLQADTVSLATQTLLPILNETLRASASSSPLASAALAQFKDFAGDMRADLAAPLIFATWADELTRGLVAPQLGQTKFKALYGKRQFRSTVEEIMAKNDSFWCQPTSCPQQSADALVRALGRLSALYGQDVTQWRWGAAHPARSVHKPLGSVPLLAPFFDVSTPTGGDPWTVNVGQYWLNEAQPFHNRHAASLRTVFDLADLEQSHFMYQTGQSGLVFSSRYRDMRPAWAAVQYRPLKLNGLLLDQTLVLKP